MAIKRAGLGKGLGALITENTTYDEKNSVIEVDINKIEPGVGQPRKNFDIYVYVFQIVLSGTFDIYAVFHFISSLKI